MRIELADAYYRGDEYLAKLRERARQVKSAVEDEMWRARMVLDSWAGNCEDFVETFLWVKIPNYHNAIKPFFLFDYQRRVIRKLQEAETGSSEHTILVDKPREMGLTWVVVAYIVWRWMFTPNWSCLVLSRTEAEVDDGTDLPDSSIFGKVRWLLSKIPRAMLPEGFAPKGKKGTSTDALLRIVNPAIGSSINGSSTNQNAGRSRRYSMVVVDECFYVENFAAVLRSLESVARVKVLVSSAKAGRQYKGVKDMCEERGDYVHLEWRDHPWKDDRWFADLQRKAEYDPEILREAVVDYAVDRRSQYYPQISESKVEPARYDPQRPLYLFLDIGRGDLTVLGWAQYHGSSLKVIEAYANRNREISWYAPFMNPELQWSPDSYPTQAQRELLERVRRWKKPAAFFGEQAHFAKSMASNTSCADVLAKLGIRLVYNSYAIKHEPRRKATSQILPMTVFNSESAHVMEMYDALTNSRYANAVAPTSPESVLKPVHDPEIADYRAAFENLAANLPRVLRLQRTERRDERAADLTNNLLRYLKI